MMVHVNLQLCFTAISVEGALSIKKEAPWRALVKTVGRPVGAEEDRQFFNAQASWAVSCAEYVCRNTYNTPLVQGDRATRNTRGRGCCGWSDMAEPPEITAPTPLSTPRLTHSPTVSGLKWDSLCPMLPVRP